MGVCIAFDTKCVKLELYRNRIGVSLQIDEKINSKPNTQESCAEIVAALGLLLMVVYKTMLSIIKLMSGRYIKKLLLYIYRKMIIIDIKLENFDTLFRFILLWQNICLLYYLGPPPNQKNVLF